MMWRSTSYKNDFDSLTARIIRDTVIGVIGVIEGQPINRALTASWAVGLSATEADELRDRLRDLREKVTGSREPTKEYAP